MFHDGGWSLDVLITQIRGHESRGTVDQWVNMGQLGNGIG